MKNILVIQTAFLGDAILTLPMIQKLKEMFPDSKLDVLTIPLNKQIFEYSLSVDDVILLDKKDKQKSILSTYKFVKVLKKNNYDKVYSPHRSLRTALMVMELGVNETYGFDNSSFKHVYKYLIPYNYKHHEVQRNLDLIGYNYPNDGWKIRPELQFDNNIINKINDFINSFKQNSTFAAIAPGSIWNTKIYPQKYYLEIIDFLRKKTDYVLVIGSERDKNICDEITSKFENNVINTAGRFSVADSIELLKRMKILISNDSAPTHFGMTADIPVLTLYCSTVPEFGFYPYNNKSYFLSFDDLKCKPCGIHGYDECPLKTFNCGFELNPEKVIDMIKEMLND